MRHAWLEPLARSESNESGSKMSMMMLLDFYIRIASFFASPLEGEADFQVEWKTTKVRKSGEGNRC